MKDANPKDDIDGLLHDAYQILSSFPRVDIICTRCFSPAGNKFITQTPRRLMPLEWAIKLFNEPTNHWSNNRAWRYYLPVFFQLLASYHPTNAFLPSLFTKNLLQMGFHEWPESQQTLVKKFLQTISSSICSQHTSDADEWQSGLSLL